LRIAALYDVHGNLPALEAVLVEVEREGVDAIVSGGDLLSWPAPLECYERLRAAGAIFVRGNADFSHEARFARIVAEWPLTAELDVDGLGTVLFCHGSPRSNEEILTRISPDARVAAALEGVDQGVVVGGHTHVQFDRVAAGRRLVNAGSVGLPYEGRPGAYWALLGPAVELRRTEYDVEAAARALDAVGTPEALDRAGWLRDPPDPDEVSAYFESTVAT
jgi:putative phosphoesterase